MYFHYELMVSIALRYNGDTTTKIFEHFNEQKGERKNVLVEMNTLTKACEKSVTTAAADYVWNDNKRFRTIFPNAKRWYHRDTHTHARATHTYFKRTDLLYATTSTECTLLLLKSNIINVLLIHILQGFKTLFFSIEHVCNSNPYSLILSPPRQSYILQLIYINWNRAPSTRSNRQKKKSSDDDDLNRMRSCTSLVSCVASIALFSYFTCQL